ncbi:MAG: DEAD/DEAH box helicase [Candidatus Pacearchaeota archaeon]
MEQVLKYLEGIKPREYQKQIFETCKDKNCLVVLPTGLGKTLIALMVAVKRMTDHPGEKVVMLAPTRPLAEQHYNTFTKHLPELFGDIKLFTGSIKAEKRKKIWQTADIIFSTPQCVANDIRKGLYDLSEVCLLVEDEAHRCVKNYDYNFLSQKYKEQAEHPRIMGLTASPGGEASKIREICYNLSIEEVELRTRESEDVKPYLQERNFEKVTAYLPAEFNRIRTLLEKIFNSYVDSLKSMGMLYGPANKKTLLELQGKISKSLSGNKAPSLYQAASACGQAIKIHHAIELLETQTLESLNNYLKNLFHQADQKKSKGVMQLVKKPEFNQVYMITNKLLDHDIEHPKLSKIANITKKEMEQPEAKVIVFAQFRDTANSIARKLNKNEGINAKVFLGQANKKESGGGEGLSQKEQKQVINEFSNGDVNVLCATSIGEEGLDIPEVNSVIFYEPVASVIRTIQRGGRTARMSKGKMIVLVTKNTRDEAYFYAANAKEKKMKKAIQSIKKDLNKSKEGSKTKSSQTKL